MSLTSKKTKKEMQDKENSSKEKLREAIQKYFDSFDKEMWKLGQRLCHLHRFNYYVRSSRFRTWSHLTGNNNAITERIIHGYSLSKMAHHGFLDNVYLIDLVKTTKFEKYKEKRKKINLTKKEWDEKRFKQDQWKYRSRNYKK